MRTQFADHVTTVVTASIAATFGVLIMHVSGMLAAITTAAQGGSNGATVQAMLNTLAWMFLAIALYVSAIVTSNTVATVVAGRTRQIALIRLIGGSASSERRRIAREGLSVGVVGAVIGIGLGTLAAWGLGSYAVAANFAPKFEYSYLTPVILLPAIAVMLTTWLAAWTGSMSVLNVKPIQAIGEAGEHNLTELGKHRARHVISLIMVIVGVALLGIGIVIGFALPTGGLVAMAGGILSFTGLVLAARVIVPPVLRFIGRLLGTSPPAILAAENAIRYPERSARSTIGLIIGVTLVTTFSVTLESFRGLIATTEANPEVEKIMNTVLTATGAIFSVLIGFSVLIAAIGMVNNLSLSVLQRTRELGLLRALGFDRSQLRGMIVAEAACLTATATVTGLVLGFLYGWAGAQSLFGSVNRALIVPGIPWVTVAVIVFATALLTLIASAAPSARALRISPVVALAAE